MNNWKEFSAYRKKQLYTFHVFSIFANLLLLVMPIFSLQIYSRVLSSHSLDTLTYLAVIAVFLLGVQALADYARQQILNNMSSAYEDIFSKILIHSSSQHAKNYTNSSQKLLQDHQRAKQYLNSPFHKTIADLPWTIIFSFVLFILHPDLGYLAIFSIVTLCMLNGIFLYIRHKNANKAKVIGSVQSSLVQQLVGRGRLSKSHLFESGIIDKWWKRQQVSIRYNTEVSLFGNSTQSLIKLFRMCIQIAVFTISAVLVIDGDIMSGTMLASSILMGRILAPIDQGAAHFFSWKENRQSFNVVATELDNLDKQPVMNINLDKVEIALDKVTLSTSNDSSFELIKNTSFALKSGQILRVDGESGSGKTLLLKLLANVIQPTKGSVLFNGLSSDKLNPESFTSAVSYLPQKIELFNGSIADNISRFSTDTKAPQAIVDLSRQLKCHQFIAKLPNSYSTILGVGGIELSSSEARRIMLASCLYGDPSCIILDDPTAYLDDVSVDAFVDYIRILKNNGKTIIFVSSEPKLQVVADFVIELKNGSLLKAYPLKEKVKDVSNITSFSSQAIKY